MIIRNFDQGTEVHHDLSMRNASFGFDVPSVNYTLKGDEVWVYPVGGGPTPIRFYSTSSQAVRELQFDQPELVRFYSSDEYYQIQWTVDPKTKAESDYMKWCASPMVSLLTHGRRDCIFKNYEDGFGISPDGKKMFADGWDINVLDTVTGEILFAMPLVEDTEEDSREIRRRMVDIVPNALDPKEYLGGVSSVGITKRRPADISAL